MIGIDASFVNAMRRILISELHTMAFENIYMWDNTSMIHDEVLAHRLGLVPLKVDARLFDEFPKSIGREDGSSEVEEEHQQRATDRNTLVFKLAVSCKKSDSQGKNDRTTSRRKPVDSVLGDVELDEVAAQAANLRLKDVETPGRPYTRHVYSRDLEWIPQGEQNDRFPNKIRPVHGDILIAKLRPGQSIELEAHAHRGNGKDHAKYSPVATASYRLMPSVKLLAPIYDHVAEELVHVYEPGVFRLVQTDQTDPPGTKVKAEVSNPYACTMSRNYMRNASLADSIRMSRLPNHFIFSVESVGMTPAPVLVAEALRHLQEKCMRLIELLDRSD